MKLDHLAFRVPDLAEALDKLEAVGFSVSEVFDIPFEDGSNVLSTALEHEDSVPEVFVSKGAPGSVVYDWVGKQGEKKGGLHHIALEVEDVSWTMQLLRGFGLEFTTAEPIVCPCETPLTQAFTKELEALGGLTIEFLTRNGHPGFCQENVKRLMDSTR